MKGDAAGQLLRDGGTVHADDLHLGVGVIDAGVVTERFVEHRDRGPGVDQKELALAVDGGIDKGDPIKDDLPGTVLGFVAGKEGHNEQQPRAKEHSEVLQKGEVSVFHGFRDLF